MAQSLVATRAAMAELVRTPDREQADRARGAFVQLRTVTVARLDHKAFAKVSPARGGRFVAWLLDGAPPGRRAALSDAVPGRC